VVDAQPTPAATAAVSLRGVRKRYDDVVAVDGVDLEVPEGTFLTLLGPSGSGKTTTLRTIGGFEIPDEGRVIVGGEDITNIPPYLRPVNTVFQTYALFPHLTVFENVAFGLRVRRLSKSEVRRRVGEELELVRLTGFEGRKPNQLSGGERQRVALARALIMRPRVLLLDEPLGSLDLKLRQQMEVELKGIQRSSGITFIYVTHDQEEALAMSDHIAVMNSGCIQQMGTPSEVYERPRSRFVAGFLGEATFFDGEVVRRERDSVTVRVPNLGELVSQGTNGVSPANTAVTVAVRPEHVACRRGLSPSGPNSIVGTVEEILIAVAMDRKVLVRLGNDQILQLLVRAGNAEDLGPGEQVCVSWPNDRTIVLEA
jgi:spermidine/putrescine transport system ATP-binding protein